MISLCNDEAVYFIIFYINRNLKFSYFNKPNLLLIYVSFYSIIKIINNIIKIINLKNVLLHIKWKKIKFYLIILIKIFFNYF